MSTAVPRMAIAQLLFPFNNAKVLMQVLCDMKLNNENFQLGYEPLPLVAGRLYYIGPRRLFLPGVFPYSECGRASARTHTRVQCVTSTLRRACAVCSPASMRH
jgi:hypothetical protein